MNLVPPDFFRERIKKLVNRIETVEHEIKKLQQKIDQLEAEIRRLQGLPAKIVFSTTDKTLGLDKEKKFLDDTEK